MPELDGRLIAIAGAAGGLGPVVAHRLATAGASLALTDVSQERLDALSAELALPDERIDARVVDLLSDDAAGEWAAALGDRFGGIDALLHLVGGWRGGDPIETAPLSDYEWLHDLLVRTVQHSTRAFHSALAASVREVRDILRVAQLPVSLDKPIGDDDESELGDFVADQTVESPHEAATENLQREDIRRALDSLPEREREVIELRYGLRGQEPMTLEEVGRYFGITRERVRQIENNTLKKLKQLPEAQRLRELGG